MFYVILAVVAGFSIILSRIINANLALKIGIYQGTFINYVVGLSLSITLVLLLPGQFFVNAGIPLWAFGGGTLGVIVVALSSYITHRISNFNITLLTFLGQLVTGVVIDLFLGNPISTTKIIGGVLIFLGLAYIIHVDSIENRESKEVSP